MEHQYHVTYSYLGPEMPGWAKEEDFGVVWAFSAEEAKSKAAKTKHPALAEWIIQHLTASRL